MEDLQERWKNWPLKNTLFLVLGLILFFILTKTPEVDSFIKGVGTLGIVGALIAGFFFVSTYTVVPAAFVIFELAKYQNPLVIAAVAAISSMLGDYIIFRFVKDRVLHELKPYMEKFKTPKINQVFKTPYFAWLLPISGALIIASPLPDEVGVSLMGVSKMKNQHFLLLAYVLNMLGILFVALLAHSV